ncbi:MAG: porin family protein [Pseudomonadota bacterium]
MQPLKTSLPIALITAISVSQNAIAEDNYVEGTVGVSTFSSYPVGRDDYTMIGARIGRNFTPNFAVEGEFALGATDSTTTFGGRSIETNQPLTVDASLKLESTYGVYGKAILPIGDRLTTHVRLGYATSEFENKGTLRSEDGTTETRSFGDIDPGLAYGVGTSFDFTDKLYARVDATRHQAFEDAIESVTLGVGLRF